MASTGWWLPQAWARRKQPDDPRQRGYAGYVDELGQSLYRGTIRNGGWSVDAGVLGPRQFRPDAERMVHEILLGGAQGELPSP
jgi:hypothetical protein